MAVYQLDDMKLLSQTPGRLDFRSSGRIGGIILILFSLVWGGVPTGVLISSLCRGPAARGLNFAVDNDATGHECSPIIRK